MLAIIGNILLIIVLIVAIIVITAIYIPLIRTGRTGKKWEFFQIMGFGLFGYLLLISFFAGGIIACIENICIIAGIL